MHQQDWGIPVEVAVDGTARIRLPLGGTVEADLTS
jgi:hypothetical protein